MTMTRARQTIGFGVLVTLLALATMWIVERSTHGSHSNSGAATVEPAKRNDEVRPAATEEYDRSDLILSQG